MIRTVTIDELPRLTECAHSFFKESGLPGTFNDAHFMATWSVMLRNHQSVIFAVEDSGKFVGAFGANAYPDILTGDLVANEMFWYVLPEFRGAGLKLLRAYETWALKLGCKRIFMVHLASLDADRLEQYYQRRGYRLIEKLYAKDLWV